MGQTLTHGVYLPDEGERNCYDGLASNWAILDGAVGTVAEHTSALAGKAPLVHTHTKSDITDFPAYGTTAGTICEGNDSRLSDARTPVAHTHTKSDVTDLFNSANTWSGNNTYSSNVLVYNSDNTANTPNLYLRNSKAEISSQGNTSGDQNFTYVDKNNTTYAYIKGAIQSNGSAVKIRVIAKDSSNNSVINELQMLAYTNGNKAIFPSYSNEIDLGTSGYKWKTFNGINPGALSLPNQDADSINLSGNITVLDGSTSNNLTQTVNGWLFIYIENTTGAYIRCYVGSGSGTRSIIRGVIDAEQSYIYVFIPIYANITVSAYINATSIARARFYPCLGNV